jgi:type IV pilus assembly protein PilA
VLTVLRKRLAHDDERGFTLIELMVVVLIIAILIAIAIPTFLGARTRAQDRSAQSNLRNGLTAAKTIFTDQQDYTLATTGATGTLKGAAPELDFVDSATASTNNKQLSVATTKPRIQLVVKSDSGTCFSITDNVTTGTSAADVVDADCKAS